VKDTEEEDTYILYNEKGLKQEHIYNYNMRSIAMN